MLKRHWRSIFIILTISTDALSFAAGGFIAYLIRDVVLRFDPVLPDLLISIVIYSDLLLIVCALVIGLYRTSFHTDRLHQYALALKTYFVALPIIVTSFYFLQWYQLPRVFTTLFFMAIPATFLAGRALLNTFASFTRSKGYGIERVLLIDQGDEGPFIFRRFDILPDLGYEAVCVAYWNGSEVPSHRYEKIRVVHCTSADDLFELLKVESIDRVLLTTTEVHSLALQDIVRVCSEANVRLKLLSQESEDLLRFAYVTDITGVPLFTPKRRKLDYFQALLKRLFDIVASLVLVLLFAPIYVATSVAIMIESGFPLIFRQRRSLVRGGKEFDFFKFRSMVKNADELKASLFEQNESDGALFKIKHDPRVTNVGRIIRRLSIDELPQLFNVLMGDMSLVGPRPLPLVDFENMNGSTELWINLKGRDGVKPGITGLWQISGRSNLGFREMVLLDFYYIENHSIFFDLEILVATIPVVLFGRGAY